MDDLFQTDDPLSSYAEGQDAFGHKFVERLNHLPDVGGTLRQKGNSSYSHRVLETHTGTAPLPRRRGDIENPMPGPERDERERSRLQTDRMRALIGRNQNGLQPVRQNDALDLGRDQAIYKGLNLVHRGLVRNNGREQSHGMSFLEMTGPKTIDAAATMHGTRESVRKSGDVASQPSRSTRGVDGAVSARPLMTGADDVERPVTTKDATGRSAIAAAVPVGSGDSRKAAAARRSTVPLPHASAMGDMSLASHDATPKETVRRDTYAAHATIGASKILSESDSRERGAGARAYVQAASIVGTRNLSENDSERTHRDGERWFAATEAPRGGVAAARRSDSRWRSEREAKGETSVASATVRGRPSEVRRAGPLQNAEPDPHALHQGVRSEALPGANTRRGGRPAVEARAGMPNVEGEHAAAPLHLLHPDETSRLRIHNHTRANILTNFVEGVRSLVGKMSNDKKTVSARVGNGEYVAHEGAPGFNTRKTPDDLYMRKGSPSKVGAQANGTAGETDRQHRDRSLHVDDSRPVRGGSNRLSQAGLIETNTSRGMRMADDAGMRRSARIL
jgi:hypothetical protein